MHFALKTTILSLTFAISAALSANAQIYRLPGQHAEQQHDLLAHQANVDAQFNLNVAKYLDFAEEEEPEEDIYSEGWDSGHVNCYKESDVPQSAVIDVTNYSMPVPGYLTSPYGYRKRFRRMHKGVDLKVNIGDTVRAAFSGKVRITQYERKGYGYYVVIRHGNDLETVYGHLSKFLVEPDQYVKAGEPIALGGNTGRSTGPHLHFETRYMGYAINPSAIFDFANQCTHTDTYTFDKRTYQKARNFSPEANSLYAQQYLKDHPNKKYSNTNKAASSSKSDKTSKYTVKKGDTLGRIAARNGVTISQICRLNNLKSSSTLSIGQKLRLR